MSVAPRPAFRIDDYTGAFVGFAAGSVMLWIGPESLPAPVSLARIPFMAVGALVAMLALTFLATDLLDIPAPWRNLIRLVYALALAVSGLAIFPAIPGCGSLLIALAFGVAALYWSSRAFAIALGVWCIALGLGAMLAHPFLSPSAVAGLGRIGILIRILAPFLVALGLLGTVARGALRGPTTLAVVSTVAVLASLGPVHGYLVKSSIVWPMLAGVAAATAIGRPLHWPQSLRAVVGRRIAFAAFAVLWLWASSAAVATATHARDGASAAVQSTAARVSFALELTLRTLRPPAEAPSTLSARTIYERMSIHDPALLWVARAGADGTLITAWPRSAAAAAPAATTLALGTAARNAVAQGSPLTSSFLRSGMRSGLAVAAIVPAGGRRGDALVAVYDLDAVLPRVTGFASRNVRVAIGDGATTITPFDNQPATPADVTSALPLAMPGGAHPWLVIATYSGKAVVREMERRAILVLIALLLATLAIIWASARFAEAVALPIRQIRERAGRLARGEAFEPLSTDNDELTELVSTLAAVSNAIRSRDHALTLAHDLTLGTFGLRETALVREMAEQAVSSYFGIAACARITDVRPAEAADGATSEWPREDAATMVLRYALRAASSTLEVRLPNALSDDDLASLSLLADTADLAIGASALLRSLNEERALLDHVYASVPVGIVLTDQLGYVARANEAASKILGESPASVAGSSLAGRLGAEELHDGRLLVGQPQRPVDVRVRPAIDGSRSLVVLRDLTEQEAVEALKSEFIAAVSHDLRTPLTAIKGFAVLLQERTDLEDEVREMLLLIDRAANRLTRMIDDLMQSALLESGRLALMVEPIPLGAAVRGLSLLEAESPSHQLVVEVPAALGVLADRDRLEQVLVNLVTNAYKYAPSGGRVLVRARAVDERVEIAVSDDGPGITREEQVRIFEKFYQASSKSGKRRGVGLGLYISRELIERMGGSLSVRSVPGFGATFAVSLRGAELGTRVERSA
ncbi:hypothetical protein EPN44_03560 [bacterium]|nr:MAG: hypothetical protein EPN44_03560 [bacterium]